MQQFRAHRLSVASQCCHPHTFVMDYVVELTREISALLAQEAEVLT